MDTSVPFLPPQVESQAARRLSQSQTYFFGSGADADVWYSHFPMAPSAFGLVLGCSVQRVASLNVAGEVSCRTTALPGWAISRLLKFFFFLILKNWGAAAKLSAGLWSVLTSDPRLGEGTWPGTSDVRDSPTS